MMLRHRMLPVAVVVGFTGLGVSLNVLTPPAYQATTRLEIRRPLDRSPWTGEAMGIASHQSENLSLYTTAKLITSRALLGELAAGLGEEEKRRILETHGRPGGLQRLLGPPETQVASAIPAAVAAPPERPGSLRLDPVVDALREMVTIEPIRDTRLLDVRVEYATPEGARILADRLARIFVAHATERSAEDDTSGLAFLERQIADVKRRLSAAGDPLATPGGSVASLRARVDRMNGTISDLTDALARVSTERLGISARLARVRAVDLDEPDTWIHQPIESEALSALRRAAIDCQMRLAAMRGIYKPKHPKLATLEAECTSLHARIREELPKAIANLEGERSVLEAREAELRRTLARIEHELGEADEGVQRGVVVESELKANQELYARLLGRVQDQQMEVRMRPRPAEIVDAAAADPIPVRPRKALNLASFLLAGLLAGGGIALLGPRRNHAFEDPGVLEEQLELPVVAVVAAQGERR